MKRLAMEFPQIPPSVSTKRLHFRSRTKFVKKEKL